MTIYWFPPDEFYNSIGMVGGIGTPFLALDKRCITIKNCYLEKRFWFIGFVKCQTWAQTSLGH
jgi:hypothetical protein